MAAARQRETFLMPTTRKKTADRDDEKGSKSRQQTRGAETAQRKIGSGKDKAERKSPAGR